MNFRKVPPQYPHTAVVHPYDFSEDRGFVGPQTIRRLECLKNAIRVQGYNIPAVVLTAGFQPNPPDNSPRQIETLASMMRRWLTLNDVKPIQCIHVSNDPTVWTTRAEMIDAIRIIKEKSLPRNILVVSTWNHIYPRMWMTWKIMLAYAPGWHLRFACATNCSVSFKHELGGTMAYLPWALWYRWKYAPCRT